MWEFPAAPVTEVFFWGTFKAAPQNRFTKFSINKPQQGDVPGPQMANELFAKKTLHHIQDNAQNIMENGMLSAVSGSAHI